MIVIDLLTFIELWWWFVTFLHSSFLCAQKMIAGGDWTNVREKKSVQMGPSDGEVMLRKLFQWYSFVHCLSWSLTYFWQYVSFCEESNGGSKNGVTPVGSNERSWSQCKGFWAWQPLGRFDAQIGGFYWVAAAHFYFWRWNASSRLPCALLDPIFGLETKIKNKTACMFIFSSVPEL